MKITEEEHDKMIKADDATRGTGIDLYMYGATSIHGYGLLGYVRHFNHHAKDDLENLIKKKKVKAKDVEGILRDLELVDQSIQHDIGLIPNHLFRAYIRAVMNVKTVAKRYASENGKLSRDGVFYTEEADATRQRLHNLIMRLAGVEKGSYWDTNVLHYYTQKEIEELEKDGT